MNMNRLQRLLPPAIVLVCVSFLAPFLVQAQQENVATSMELELKPKHWYYFVAAGREYSEQGTAAQVRAVNDSWVEVEFFGVARRSGWINLNQVGAIKRLSAAESEAISVKERDGSVQ